MQKATTQEIVAAYRETGSVWKAAKQLGMAGQSVHERLVAAGFPLRGRKWTDDEVAELRDLIENLVPLGDVARRLGRPYAGVAAKASELAIRSTPRSQRKVPRGSGYDKASMKEHIKALWRYEGTITQFARSRSLAIEPFVQAFQRHYPDAWSDYTATHSVGERRVCPYCEEPFYPMSARQQFCTRKCQSDAKRDEQYFGGNRRNTIGLRAGICQLCGGERTKGLSSHHVLGKENDPGNVVLIALCRGCHQLVGQLAARKMVDDAAAWEALISLVWMRRNGTRLRYGEAFAVLVEMGVEAEAFEMDEVIPAEGMKVLRGEEAVGALLAGAA